MKRTNGVFLALACVLLSPMAANAVPVVAANGDIGGLNVGGSYYDVTWNFGSVDPGAGDFSLFDGNQAFADSFMDAVLAAFNDSGFGGVSGQTYYGVDYGSLLGALVVDSGGGSFSRADSVHNNWACCTNAGWGSVTAVPEPATLSLLGLGLLGIGAVRSRRRA